MGISPCQVPGLQPLWLVSKEWWNSHAAGYFFHPGTKVPLQSWSLVKKALVTILTCTKICKYSVQAAVLCRDLHCNAALTSSCCWTSADVGVNSFLSSGLAALKMICGGVTPSCIEKSYLIDHTVCNRICVWARESCDWQDSSPFTDHVTSSIISEKTFLGGQGRRVVFPMDNL